MDLTIYKVSASMDQNCKRSYPEMDMLKNLSEWAVTLLKITGA